MNDWDCESRDSSRTFGSDGTTVACSSGETTRELMSNESRLLDVLAAARNRNGDLQWKTIVKCVRQHKCGVLGAVGNCEEFDPVLVHRANRKRKTLLTRWESMMSFPDLRLRREDVASLAPGGSQ